jgi:hypothetical protein
MVLVRLRPNLWGVQITREKEKEKETMSKNKWMRCSRSQINDIIEGEIQNEINEII